MKPYKYINFRKDTYYIHGKETKTGKMGYICSQKEDNALAELPEGYEIYENPNAQVFCRKIQKKLITDAEIQLVEKLLKKHCKLSPIKIDIKKNCIFIWTPDPDNQIMASDIGIFDLPFKMLLADQSIDSKTKEKIDQKRNDFIAKYSRLHCDLRFTLVKAKTRTFVAERFCYLGSIDDWIILSSLGENSLEELIKETVIHLGEESFFELD